MKAIQVTGLLLQLLGAWSLCRLFYKVRSPERDNATEALSDAHSSTLQA